MVCEFLPYSYKRKLVEIATEEDLLMAGYMPSSVKKIKQRKVISDTRCERLVEHMGERAKPILLQAIKEFAKELGVSVIIPALDVEDEIKRIIRTEVEYLLNYYCGKPKRGDNQPS